MLLLASYDIVFQEVPGEVTLALNLSACPNNCPGCHSPHLRGQVGETLDEGLLEGLLSRYGVAVSCVAFMGGDADPHEVARLAGVVRLKTHFETRPEIHPKTRRNPSLKTAWYSGKPTLPKNFPITNFDFIKLGPYIESLGGLSSPRTNQRFYRVEEDAAVNNGGGGRKLVDSTSLFRENR